MKRIRMVTLLCVAALVALVAPESVGATATVDPVAGIYVARDGAIDQYGADKNGMPSQLTPSSVAASSPVAVTVNSAGNYLYSLSCGSGVAGIQQFSVRNWVGASPSTDRTLTPLRSVSLGSCTKPNFTFPEDGHLIAESPSSQFVFASATAYDPTANTYQAQFAELAVGTSGALRLLNTVPLGVYQMSDQPTVDVQVSANSKLLYVFDGTVLRSYAIAKSGALTPVAQLVYPNCHGYGSDMVLAPNGGHLYLSQARAGCNLQVLALDSTGHFLSSQDTAAFAGSLAMSADGSTLYTGQYQVIESFRTWPDGHLTQFGTPVYPGNDIPTSLAVAPNGTALFAAVNGSQGYGLDVIPIVNGLMVANFTFIRSANTGSYGLAIHK